VSSSCATPRRSCWRSRCFWSSFSWLRVFRRSSFRLRFGPSPTGAECWRAGWSGFSSRRYCGPAFRWRPYGWSDSWSGSNWSAWALRLRTSPGRCAGVQPMGELTTYNRSADRLPSWSMKKAPGSMLTEPTVWYSPRRVERGFYNGLYRIRWVWGPRLLGTRGCRTLPHRPLVARVSFAMTLNGWGFNKWWRASRSMCIQGSVRFADVYLDMVGFSHDESDQHVALNRGAASGSWGAWGATLRSRWGRCPLLAHFPPKHHCQSSGQYCSEHAYPQRNNHAIQGDFPTPKKSEDVRDGNQPKNNSGDKGERLHICPSLKADEGRRLYDAGEVDATVQIASADLGWESSLAAVSVQAAPKLFWVSYLRLT